MIRIKGLIMLAACASLAACGSDDNADDAQNATSAPDPNMSFFLTSVGPGDGGNLGGLAGADAHCAQLAKDAGVTGKTWRAYLSTTGEPAINAKDRIGEGPWRNANGDIAVASLAELLSDENKLSKEISVSETGAVINGRGDSPNRHDILTGTTASGEFTIGDGDTTCSDWTSNAADGSAIVGHHDRTGGGDDPTSWSSAHGSRGCGQADLQRTGGDGLFYCFAVAE
ncbi:MAG: hypothetical protein AAGJ73_07605 [Pseudomonadota bacterium]